MVIGYHLILSAYGFWLPNDPRGSCSRFVGAKHLFRFGKATTVSTRRSVVAAPHDRELRRRARNSLRRTAIRFSGIQARAMARGFAFTTVRYDLPVWACSLLPDHVHLVIGRTGRSVETVAAMFKADATRQILHEHLHPFAGVREKNGRLPSIWASGIWKVFLSTPTEVHSRIGYVERNPVKAGYRLQRWSFVRPFEP